MHFALTAPFLTLTGLWAFPYLVQGEGLSQRTAAALLASAVVVFGISAPALAQFAARMPHRRGTIASAVALTIAGTLAVTLAWPGGHPPVALVALMLALSGVGSAASMLAFDLAREAPGAGVSASGMVNLGGFSAAIVAQAAIAMLVGAHLGFRIALLPLLAIVVTGALQTLRHPRVQ